LGLDIAALAAALPGSPIYFRRRRLQRLQPDILAVAGHFLRIEHDRPRAPPDAGRCAPLLADARVPASEDQARRLRIRSSFCATATSGSSAHSWRARLKQAISDGGRSSPWAALQLASRRTGFGLARGFAAG